MANLAHNITSSSDWFAVDDSFFFKISYAIDLLREGRHLITLFGHTTRKREKNHLSCELLHLVLIFA